MLKSFWLSVLLSFLLFVTIEGLCSVLHVVRQYLAVVTAKPAVSAVQYDADLGWNAVPNFYAKNYFAPGVFLQINSQGFRASEEFSTSIPAGRFRVICAGDSQTFGLGVDNDHTWCQLLESMDSRFQTVNIGQGAYGFDQIYLRYRRDGSVLNHDVQLFAVATDDFRRATLKSFMAYPKPLVKLENGELVTDNVPVPRQSPLVRRFALRMAQVRGLGSDGELRSFAFLNRLYGRLLPARDPWVSRGPTEQQLAVLDKMIESEQTINKRKNSTLVLIYLPTRNYDYDRALPARACRAFLRSESEKRHIPLIDLVDDFQKLPVTAQDAMFFSEESNRYSPDIAGHYSDLAQQYLAQQIYSRLIAIPEIRQRLSRVVCVADSSPLTIQDPSCKKGMNRETSSLNTKRVIARLDIIKSQELR